LHMKVSSRSAKSDLDRVALYASRATWYGTAHGDTAAGT
jgi:hypothetical protein